MFVFYTQLSQAFAEMMFKHGFVHCDPHAANVLVRPLPSGSRSIFGESFFRSFRALVCSYLCILLLYINMAVGKLNCCVYYRISIN